MLTVELLPVLLQDKPSDDTYEKKELVRMKRRTIRLIVILLVIGLIFIIEPFRNQPPLPDVSVGNQTIPTQQGSYCWHGLIRGQCVDYIYTNPLEMTEKLKPTVVQPESPITIAFHDGPAPDDLKIEQWQDAETRQTVTLHDEQLKAPDARGIYVYHVLADWEQGDGNSAFVIEVK